MSGCRNNLNLEQTEGKFIPIRNGAINAGDFAFLGLRTNDADAEFGFQLLIAFDMVEVVVGREDEVQRPATALKRRFDGICVGRIDRRRQGAFRIMNENAIIIATADELLDIEPFVDLGHGVLHFHAFVIRLAP